MTGHSVPPASARRSLWEWMARALLAVSALWCGYAAVNQSLVDVLRRGSPERAHRLAPDDGLAAAALSKKLSGVEATLPDRARADSLARDALRREPTAVSAVWALGLNAQIRGKTTAARRIFAYAQQLSRRDLQVQLWAIEDAVARNDIAAALRHYDVALRTSRLAPELLFPTLAGAITEAAIRTELVRVLAHKPPWGRDFVVFAAAISSDPNATVSLLREMLRARVAVPPAASARAIDALAATGDVAGAWHFYSVLHPSAVRQGSRDPRFTVSQAAPTQFDWSTIDNTDVTAAIEASSGGGRFDFATSPGAGGPVLRQMQMLPPGEYVMEGVAGVDPSNAPRPYWSLTCSDGRDLGRVDFAQSYGRFVGTMRVPSNCSAQMLTLVTRSSEQMTSISGQVTEARLHPVGRPR